MNEVLQVTLGVAFWIVFGWVMWWSYKPRPATAATITPVLADRETNFFVGLVFRILFLLAALYVFVRFVKWSWTG